jgi:predicted  nucleic acid-binding Zn-ribbon protein
MNDDRRKRLDELREKLVALDNAFEELTSEASYIKEELEGIKDEEQESFDNLPESMQNGERGEKMSTAISELENVIDGLNELAEHSVSFDDWIANIDTAKE